MKRVFWRWVLKKETKKILVIWIQDHWAVEPTPGQDEETRVVILKSVYGTNVCPVSGLARVFASVVYGSCPIIPPLSLAGTVYLHSPDALAIFLHFFKFYFNVKEFF